MTIALFLRQVTKLLEKNDGEQSIYITQKRLPSTESMIQSEPMDDLQDEVKPIVLKQAITENKANTYKVLIRVTNGGRDKASKIKLSTIVDPEELEPFWASYTKVLKAGFPGLKKRSKKKKKKKKHQTQGKSEIN